VLPTIERGELQGRLDRGDDLVLVEALPEKYYRHTHLPGAVNLPPDRARELAAGLLPGRDAEIVVYCGSFR
jgi:rhodanese-related sulfurtransferase